MKLLHQLRARAVIFFKKVGERTLIYMAVSISVLNDTNNKYTVSVSSWDRTVANLVLGYYGTRRFISVFTIAHPSSVRQMNLVHTTIPSLFETSFNINIPSAPISSKLSLSYMFSDKFV